MAGIGTVAVGAPLVFGYSAFKSAAGAPQPNLDPYTAAPEISRPPKEPFAPILLVVNDSTANPFSRYLAEILLAEGINAYQAVMIDKADLPLMRSYPLVLLAEGALSEPQAEMMASYVLDGGHLICMRPSAEFAGQFGLEFEPETTSDGYWWSEQAHPSGQGVSTEVMQFHGSADHYPANQWETLAWLSAAPDRDSAAHPAVVSSQHGKGEVNFWAFDLARSVVLTRQGNPAWTNQERDDRDGIRALDAFVDWMDLDRIAVPQADEQMRLFSGQIATLLANDFPLPRMWYFPEGKMGVLVATGDSHQNPRTIIDKVLGEIEQVDGNISVYYTPPTDSDWKRAVRRASWFADDVPVLGSWVNKAEFPTPDDVQDWRGRGHEFAFHPYVETGLEEGWRDYWETFTGLGYGNTPLTVRTHRILWHGWVETARVQATYGIGMNLDYYHYGPALQKKNGEWATGHFNGTGLPMRFVDGEGRVLAIFQQTTQLVDEHLIKMPWGIGGPNVGGEAGVGVAEQILQSCLDSAPAAIGAQFHIDPFIYGEDIKPDVERFLKGTLEAAGNRDIPIWTAEQWLKFNLERQTVDINSMKWEDASGDLTFELNAATGSENGVALIVPLAHHTKKLSRFLVDHVEVSAQILKIHNIEFGWFSVRGGSHFVIAQYQ